MKNIILIIALATLFTNCGNTNESGTSADTTVSSTTPPPRQDTNPVGLMMGDTTIGINDSLNKGGLKK